MEILAELGGRTAFVLAEQAVEVRQRVEAAVITNLCYRVGCIYQHSGGRTKPHLSDVI